MEFRESSPSSVSRSSPPAELPPLQSLHPTQFHGALRQRSCRRYSRISGSFATQLAERSSTRSTKRPQPTHQVLVAESETVLPVNSQLKAPALEEDHSTENVEKRKSVPSFLARPLRNQRNTTRRRQRGIV